MFHFILSSIF